ncbi:MAG: ABC transporter ATP-binding protein/permease [Tissierellales bacterium]|jgi:ATP-binding cassette subfamily B protein/subfamily B ATP-binding cassette protein MsbA|nr:ABC transporter ATP-binding protein/permease [Tissierellales bacterium]
MSTKRSHNIFLRLLKYAKPYISLLLICLLFVFLSTAADLARPYLIKIAIDDCITPSNEIVSYDGKDYKLLIYDNSPLLIDASNADKPISSVEFNNSSVIVHSSEETFNAKQLSKLEYDNLRKNDLSKLFNITIIFLIVLTSAAIFNYAQIYILNYVGQKVIYNLRAEIFAHIQKLSLSFFNKNPIGKLVTRATNDMKNISELFTDVLITLLKDMLLILGTIGIMLKINMKVSLICLSTIPLLILLSFIFRKFARKSFLEVKKKLGIINASLSENITGMSVIQIFGQEEKMFNRFHDKNRDHYNSSVKQLLIFAIFRPSMNVIYTMSLCLLIWFGGGEVLRNELPFGVLFAFINYTEQLFRPIFDLSEKFNILESAMASSERVFQILDTKEEIPRNGSKILESNFDGKIEFKNVYFAYDKEWILEDVSFVIKPGQTAAFVGATGSGKTTIMSLLTRLYDIQKGQILIDNIDIRDYDLDYLRSQINSVLQDVFLFAGTIEENIHLNDPNVSSDTARKAAKFVNADTFISKFNDNYNHMVVENGATLSSGQKQLISFARALAFSPSILILDEATSNIDTETELLIQDATTKVMKGRTTLVVAHRLSTIQHADQIIVLHHGKIKEIGTHQELLKQNGMYHTLYKLQYKESQVS